VTIALRAGKFGLTAKAFVAETFSIRRPPVTQRALFEIAMHAISDTIYSFSATGMLYACLACQGGTIVAAYCITPWSRSPVISTLGRNEYVRRVTND
jgi:hypothetical protein